MITPRTTYRHHWLSMLMAVVVMASTAVSCSSEGIDRKLSDAERLLEQYPDSALSILESIETNLPDNEVLITRYGRLNARARLMCGKTIANDRYLDRCISYYLKDNDSIYLSQAYQLASIRSQHRLNQDSSVYYLQQAIKTTPENQKDIRARLLTKMAYQLSRPQANKDYRKALAYSKEALEYATTDEELRADTKAKAPLKKKKQDCKCHLRQTGHRLVSELDGLSAVAKFATTASDGKAYLVEYYNI